MLAGGAVGGRVSATGGVARAGAGSVRVVTPSSSPMLGEGVVGGEPVCDAACVDRSGPIGKRSVTGPLDGADALAASAVLGGAADEAGTAGLLMALRASSGRDADEAGTAGLLTVLGTASGRGAEEAGTAGLLTVLGPASGTRGADWAGTAGLLTVRGVASPKRGAAAGGAAWLDALGTVPEVGAVLGAAGALGADAAGLAELAVLGARSGNRGAPELGTAGPLEVRGGASGERFVAAGMEGERVGGESGPDTGGAPDALASGARG